MLRRLLLPPRVHDAPRRGPVPDGPLLPDADAGRDVPARALLPGRGEHVPARVRARHVQRRFGEVQLHFMSRRPHLPGLVAQDAGDLPRRLRLLVAGFDDPSADVPRRLLVRRRDGDFGSFGPGECKTDAVRAGDVLQRGGCAQLYNSVDPHVTRGPDGAAAVQRRHLLQGGGAVGGRVGLVLRRALLSARVEIPDASAPRLVFGQHGIGGADNVLPRVVRAFAGRRRVFSLPRGLLVPGLRDVRAVDLRRRHVPLSRRFRHVPPLPDGHVLDVQRLDGHFAVSAVPGRPRLRGSRDDEARPDDAVPGRVFVRRRNGPLHILCAQVPRWPLLRLGDSSEFAV
mmetsp:Transcript_26913/g.96040  ORF Transcript_26913/g.96040 Transcript_26913/m.96040 type:complete len:342 (-) Transcript_26913:274-1299(-)